MGKAKFSKLEIVLSALFCAVVVVACVLIGVLATKRSEASSEFSPSCPNVEAAERIDCIPDQVATKNLCNLRGCCWSPQIGTSTPWCFFSSNHGYRVDGELRTTQQGFQATLKRFSSPSLFGDDINTVLLTAEYQTQNRFHFKLTDPAANRFEVPHEHIGPFSGSAASNLKYSVNVQQNPFGIRVTRVSTGKVL